MTDRWLARPGIRPTVLTPARVATGGWPGDRTEFRLLLESCDVVSLRLPSIDSTHNLTDTDAAAALPDQAVLVDTARTRIMDGEAVVRAVPAAAP